jgi:hypothetical protein
MGNAVEKGPDVKIQNPVLVPATLPGHGQCVMGTPPRTITVAVRMEDRLQLVFQQPRGRGLSDSVRRVRDGGFILPLLGGCAVFWDRLVKVLGVPEQG